MSLASLANGASGILRGFEAEADLRPKAGMLRSHLLLQDFAHVEISDASDKTSHVGAFTRHKVAVHVRGIDDMSHCNTRYECGGAK